MEENISKAIDPISEVFQSDITRMAQHFWLTVIPQQLGPAIHAWIQDPGNQAEFRESLSGIGFCDFFGDSGSALNGQSPPSIEEGPEPITIDAQIQEESPWTQHE